MSDTFDVRASWSKPSYNVGETMVATISGTNTHTTDETTVTQTDAPFDVLVVSDGGVHSTVSVPEIQRVTTIPGTTTVEQVFIDAPAGAVLSFNGRQYTVSTDRKRLSAVA